MRTDKIIEQLEALEETFDEKKESLARDEGRLESLQERMEKDFGVKTLKKAESELTKLDKQIESSEEELHDKYAKMKEAMEKIDVQQD
jgi:flagellar capping protein FliD